jgi:uncharacterized membrane protein YkvA (DUF1232 family)
MELGWVVAIVVGLLAAWALMLAIFWVLRPKGASVRELVAVVPDLLRLIRSLIRDRAVAIDVRIVMVAMLVWLLSPVDLIPEFIPVLGPLDDVVVSIVALRYVRRRLGIDELRQRWLGSEAGFDLVAQVIGSGATS